MTDTATADTATETAVAAEVAAPEIVATEAEQQVAPTEDVALETPGTSGDATQQLLSKHEARKAMQEARQAKQQETRQQQEQDAGAEDAEETITPETAEAAPDDIVAEEQVEVEIDEATGRKRDAKTGQFLSEGEGDGEAVAAEAATEEAPVAEVEPIRVPVPEDHAVWKMGQATLTAENPEQEQVIRALLNGTYERVKAVEAKDTIIAARDETIRDLRQEKVHREASEAAMGQYEETDAYKAHRVTFETLKAAEAEGSVPAGTASTFWQSAVVQQEVEPLAKAEFEQRWSEVEDQQNQEQGEIFMGDALQSAETRFAPEVVVLPEFRQVFDTAIVAFGAALQAGRYPELTTPEQHHAKFDDLLRTHLVQNVNVRTVLSAQMAKRDNAEEATKRAAAQRNTRAAESKEKAAEARGAEQARKDAAEKRQANPTHPLGKLADANRGAGESGPTGTPSPETEPDNIPQHHLKRHFKKQAREAARQRYSQR